MSLGQRVSDDNQLARLLQIGVVLEEVVESRAHQHIDRLPPDERAALDDELRALLSEAAEESARHRERLAELIERLDAEPVPSEDINRLVEAKYTAPADSDGVLYDQLCNEETAYKFYDDLIEAIENSDTEFSVDTAAVLETLSEIRAEEEAGVEEVTALMERRA